MLWRYPQGASALSGLSLAVGVAVIRALRSFGAGEAQLKWPNDVLWRGRKLAGILVELSGDALGPSAVVVGVGVNVRLSRAMKGRIDQPAADLETACGREVDRNVVLGTLVTELAAILETFAIGGFAPLREEWERYHAHQGCRVTVTLPGGARDNGVARGIGDDGALLFETGNALRRLHSGEISLRASSDKRA
jgi:BirA family biotin operon repressor/biotin-[acetyl-CoA-carboxylase] ligase